MRQYTYSLDNIYTGFVDSAEVVENSTPIPPETDLHIVWNGVLWEVETAVIYTLDELKTIKKDDARKHFDEIVRGLEDDVADFEVQTWETQRHEWLAYIQDANAITPYCDMLCLTRQVSKEHLMERIGYNVVGFAQIQGSLHRIEDIVNSCTTESELDLVVW